MMLSTHTSSEPAPSWCYSPTPPGSLHPSWCYSPNLLRACTLMVLLNLASWEPAPLMVLLTHTSWEPAPSWCYSPTPPGSLHPHGITHPHLLRACTLMVLLTHTSWEPVPLIVLPTHTSLKPELLVVLLTRAPSEPAPLVHQIDGTLDGAPRLSRCVPHVRQLLRALIVPYTGRYLVEHLLSRPVPEQNTNQRLTNRVSSENWRD